MTQNRGKLSLPMWLQRREAFVAECKRSGNALVRAVGAHDLVFLSEEAIKAQATHGAPTPAFHNGEWSEALRAAAQLGRLDCLRLIAPLADCASDDRGGATALFLAAQNARADCVRFLLPLSDATQANLAAETPLMAAAKSGCLESAKLLAPFSDAQAQNANGATALILAANAQRAETVKFLLPLSDAKASDHGLRTALMCAAIHGDEEMLEALLPVSDARAQDASGATALMWAVMKDKINLAPLLLPASDLGQRHLRGHDALMMAAIRGFSKWVRALIEAASPAQLKAMSLARDENGRDALMLAAQEGDPWHAECLPLLLPLFGAKTRDAAGRDALMIAAQTGGAECVEALAREADARARDNDANSAFQIAAGAGSWVAALALAPLSSLADVERAVALLAGQEKDGKPHSMHAPLKSIFEAREMALDLIELRHGAPKEGEAKRRTRSL